MTQVGADVGKNGPSIFSHSPLTASRSRRCAQARKSPGKRPGNSSAGGTAGIRTLDRVAPIHAFQACPFNHSGTVPALANLAEVGAEIKPHVGSDATALQPLRIKGVTPTALLAVLASYLLGSIPAAAWVARGRGVDIRTVGSGNSGATNVLRSLGKGPALLVAVFDILKGALAVLLGRALHLPEPWAAACGLVAVVGHNFSPFLRFRGGKGVATSFGTLVMLQPLVGAGAFALAIACMWLTRFVSAGSIMGALATIVLILAIPSPLWLTLMVSALALLLIWQHRENIVKLQAGTERRLGEKVPSAPAANPPQKQLN